MTNKLLRGRIFLGSFSVDQESECALARTKWFHMFTTNDMLSRDGMDAVGTKDDITFNDSSVREGDCCLMWIDIDYSAAEAKCDGGAFSVGDSGQFLQSFVEAYAVC